MTASLPPADRLARLRAVMAAQRPALDVWLTPSSDEHLNEYLPDCAQRRDWLSGFDGSAGDALATAHEAWLFVDGRYHQQAAQQTEPSLWQVSRLGVEGQPSLNETLQRLAKRTPGLRIGYDPWVMSLASVQSLEVALKPLGAKLVACRRSLLDQAWGRARPKRPAQPVFALPTEVTGETVAQRLQRARAGAQAALGLASTSGGDWLLPLVRLDQIAWLLNLRGSDIPYNPVFLSYLLLSETQACLFAAESAFSPALREALAEQNVALAPYESLSARIREIAPGKTALIDPDHVTAGMARTLRAAGARLTNAVNPLPMMKAVKTPAELRGMRESHLRASAALIRFWRELERRLTSGAPLSELEAARLADGAYADDAAFAGLSFNTIAAYGANGAIIHYGAPDSQTMLTPGGLFLLDSGAHYYNADVAPAGEPWAGTTDTTRVFALDTPSDKARACFTAVLAAHVACLRQRFPKGTTGAQLDAITRSGLWNAGLDFRHGTGHGVGAFLNVHEGPIGIHARARTPLAPGMIVSVEPGYYEPGWGGVRIENLAEVVALKTPEGSAAMIAESAPAYGFESLVWVPYDPRLIDVHALDAPTRAWIDGYHAEIRNRVAHLLTASEREWLALRTRPL